MEKKYILTSDVVTLPTEAMRKAMYEAEVGNDVAGEDPSVNKLEEKAAQAMGKQAAAFMASGTMTNVIAAMAHCERNFEVITEEESHFMYYEVGSIARLANLMPRTVRGTNGIMDPQDIRDAIRGPNIHYPDTGLICLENTHNRGGGTVIPMDNIKRVRAIADELSVPIHLDGARIYNATTYLGNQPTDITQYVDTVTFCLSKGLSAPIGAVLCGPKDFIARTKHLRKMFGGGWRQAGHMAAAGIVAMDTMVERLSEDHANARRCAEMIADNPKVTVNMDIVQTNIFKFSVENSGKTAAEFAKALAAYNVFVQGRPPYDIRAVFHRHISKEDTEQIAKAIVMVANG